MATRTPLIAANWKMHGDRAFAARYGAELGARALPPGVRVVVLPPAPYLGVLRDALGAAPVALGGQAAHAESKGAFTGEVSAEMLVDLGASWVLVGHSERRQAGETDEHVAARLNAARRAGLQPILCVGETLAEREAGSAEAVVGRQIRRACAAGSIADLSLAYEPVWAIGSGRTATPEQAQAMHERIRTELAAIDPSAAAGIRILYGGSVKADNAAALLVQPDIDGALVGGASLDVEEFAAIIEAAGN